MDNSIAIEVNHLSKAYKMYEKPIDRLKETLFFGRRTYHRNFYALDDVSFQVKRGETLGIIGRNGAGKSTLLKIITGVLQPTSGEVKVNGRISSLLELGAGFNPEFTGIENIYLNGTVMGFTREEMDARVQDILDFADIGDFVYQPVKTYSSGMYVRLAFAVAINVEPEILIVDEALAVGDARFQHKCFMKIETIKRNGATVLFVTHDMGSVKQLCDWAILMRNGKIVMEDKPNDVCIEYFKELFPEDAKNKELNEKESSSTEIVKEGHDGGRKIINPNNAVNSFGCGGAIITDISIQGVKDFRLTGNDKLKIRLKISIEYNRIRYLMIENELINNLIFGASFSDIKGNYIFGMTTYDKGIYIEAKKGKTEYDVEFKTTFPMIEKGSYVMNAAVALGTQENHIQLKWYDAVEVFEMEPSQKYIYGLIYNEYESEVNNYDV